MTAYIGHDNIFEDGTVTATSEATGYPMENAYDWMSWDYWKPSSSGTFYLTVDMGSSVPVNYWALSFTDLSTQNGYVIPQYSSDNFSADINNLIEGTNLFTYSENFGTASWTKSNSSISTGYDISPDGNKTANRLIENATTGIHGVYQSHTVSSGYHIFSAYVKAGERTWVDIGTTSRSAYFNLETGEWGTVHADFTTSSIDCGNGWYRIGVAYVATAGTRVYYIRIATGNGTNSYSGSTANGIYIFGAMLEQSTTWHNYVPTKGTDSVYAPPNTDTIFRLVTETKARYWRFKFYTQFIAPRIGMVAMGKATDLDRGMPTTYVTPRLGRNKSVLNSTSEGGGLIGRTVLNNGYKFNIANNNADPDWVDQNWGSLADHMEINPFFFAHDYDNRPFESIFAWTDGDITYPTYNGLYQSFSIPCKGLR